MFERWYVALKEHYKAQGELEWFTARGLADMKLAEALRIIMEERPADKKALAKVFTAGLNVAESPERRAWREQVSRADGELPILESGISDGPEHFKTFRAVNGSLGEALGIATLWSQGEFPPLLTLAGDPGVGKTHLALSAARAANNRKQWVLYRSEAQLVTELQGHIGKGSFEATLKEVCESPYLIIDDLGLAATRDWGKAIMDQIIDARWQGAVARERWTLITTNLKPGELPARIESRLRDGHCGRVVTMVAPDWRKAKALV